MKTEEQKATAPAAAPVKTHEEVVFLKDHQLEGHEVKKDDKRSLAVKTAKRLRDLNIVK